jgi:hypothetical protein
MPVRVSAPDLRGAQRLRSRIRAEAIVRGDAPDRLAVILDLAVVVADDFRSARAALASADTASTLCYAGTASGLADLIADIFVAGVADGVTLIPIVPGVDARAWADDVLGRLSRRLPVANSADCFVDQCRAPRGVLGTAIGQAREDHLSRALVQAGRQPVVRVRPGDQSRAMAVQVSPTGPGLVSAQRCPRSCSTHVLPSGSWKSAKLA